MNDCTATRAGGLSAALIAGLLVVSAAGPVAALERDPKEKAELKACERSICAIALGKKPTGEALSCKLQKTWAKKEIADGAKQTSIDWSLGDARCSVDLNVPQSEIVTALTADQHDLQFPTHKATCIVDRDGEISTVTMNLAPKLTFENGQATAAKLGISDIEGPTILGGFVQSVATVQSTFGLFEGALTEEVNEFLGQKCGKRYPELAKK